MDRTPRNLLPANQIGEPVTVPEHVDRETVQVRIQRVDGEVWLEGEATAWTSTAVHVHWTDQLQHVGWFAPADVRRSPDRY